MGARAVQGPHAAASVVVFWNTVCMSEGDVCHQKGKHTLVWPPALCSQHQQWGES